MPKLDKLRLIGLFGIFAPIVSLLAVILAISLSPWFSWSANALSDLGVGEAASVFNYGLMLGAILAAIFAIGLLANFKKQKLKLVGALIYLLAAFALFCIGVFTEDAGDVHYYVSVAYFALSAITLLIIGSGAVLAKSQKFGAVTIILGLLAALPWALSWTALAVPELLSALAISLWSIVQGAMLTLGKA